MATAAFNSTARRGAAEPEAPKPTPSLGRSHNVNAVSRKTRIAFEDCHSISSEFSVRRDNPLFWTSSSSPPDNEEEEESSLINGGVKHSSYSSENHLSGGSNGSHGSEVRGRSVTRSGGVRNGIGRSFSRVRGRSVSGAHGKGVYEMGF